MRSSLMTSHVPRGVVVVLGRSVVVVVSVWWGIVDNGTVVVVLDCGAVPDGSQIMHDSGPVGDALPKNRPLALVSTGALACGNCHTATRPAQARVGSCTSLRVGVRIGPEQHSKSEGKAAIRQPDRHRAPPRVSN